MSTFTDRGKHLAEDIYDGNEPDKIRSLSNAIVKVRSAHNLLEEITRAGQISIAPVLLNPEFKDVQRLERSIFLFIDPQRLLDDAERRLAIHQWLHLYRSDLWID